MAYTAAQINTIFQAVLQRPADTYAIQTFANSTSSDASVRTQIETSYEASVNVNPVIRLYQGAFGRVPDTGGLQANYNTYINGYNIVQLAQNFLSSTEGMNKFGASASVTAGFVSTLYTQALGRTAGSSEISYWQGTGKSAAQVLAEISNSTEAVNKEAAPIVTWLDSAATAALSGGQPNGGSLYSQTSSTGGSTGGTSNPGQTIPFTATNGDNLQGTSGNDTFIGTANVNAATTPGTIQAGDVVTGNGGTDTVVFNAAPAGTLVLPTLNGIAIANIANKTGGVTADFSNSGVSLVTVQNASGISSGTGGTSNVDSITLKSGQVAGLDNVKFTGATSTASTSAAGVTDAAAAAAAASEVFKFGTGTSASLALANGTNISGTNTNTNTANGVLGTATAFANSVDLQGANLTTINVQSAGTTANTVANLIDSTGGANLKNLNISGTAGLTLGTGITTLTTIDATANGSGVKLSATETGLTSAKFGAGNDSFLTGDSFAATANAAVTATIDGGTGTNNIGANIASLANLLGSTNKVTNFQVLEVQASAAGVSIATGNGGTAYDLSKIASLTSVQFDGSVTTANTGAGAANPVIFNNLVAGGSITFGGGVTSTNGAGNLVFNLTSGTSNATETVIAANSALSGVNANTTAGAADNIGAFTLQNVSNLVLNVKDIAGTGTAGVTTFNGVADSALTSITLQSTAVDNSGAATKGAAIVLGAGFSSTNITNLDASGSNGNVDVSAVTFSTGGATIKGGSGEMYTTGSAGNDTITSGSGGGIFNTGNGADSLTLSATVASTTGANVAFTQTGVATVTTVLDVVSLTGGQHNNVLTNLLSVTGFHLGANAAASDVISFNGTATGIAANQAALAAGGAGPGNTATFASAAAGATNVANAVNGSQLGQSSGVTVTINSSGLATVSGATGTDAVTAVQKYLNANLDAVNGAGAAVFKAGETAAIIVGSDTYVIHTGTDNTTASDSIVKLVGVANETGISTTAYNTSTIHIA